jgi:mannose-6-phosphate isomerase
MTLPILPLESNQPQDRFYRGGDRIAKFRRQDPVGPDARVPEDWVGSATTLFGEDSLGLTTLPDRTLLRDAIAADPAAWLGDEHVARFGDDPMLLVKLLHAGQRLPVHAHPGTDFAARELGRHHGKAEAWYVVDGGSVGVGFREDVPADVLRRWVDAQHTEALFGLLNAVEVEAGDTVFVPQGTPHALGEGTFVVEVQEPEDLSILLEWDGFEIDGAEAGHLTLGFDRALEAVNRDAFTADDVAALVTRAGAAELLPSAAGEYFRLERIEAAAASGGETAEAGFSILVALTGSGTVTDAHGTVTEVTAGDTLLVPFSAGGITVAGSLSVLRCRPPRP